MMADAPEKKVLTTTEVAMMLGTSDDFVRRLCEQGQLDGDPGQSIEGCWRPGVGGKWRIPRCAVEWFLKRARPIRRAK